MLYIYTGKLTYLPYATNTIITFIVPDGIEKDHPCMVSWQWAVNGAGVKNVNIKFTGQFLSTTDNNNVEIRAYDVDYYWFVWSRNNCMVQLMDKTGAKCGPQFQVTQVFPNKIAFE